MADWRQIRNDFRIDQLTGLNVKLLKDTEVFYSPINPVVGWDGWKLRKGQITGKLFSWIDSTPANQNYPALDVTGLWLMFYLMDDWTGAQHAYFIKIESKLIDWEYIKEQLDEQRKRDMNWYEQMFDDLDTAIEAKKDEVEDAVQNGLMWGGILAAGILYFNFVGRYQLQAQVFKGAVKDVVKELKN